jgi:DNA-3-methyladenine glycosylase I
MPEIDAHKTRCFGNGAGHEILAAYHDTEWGVPVHDDRLLFEMLTLEGAQAGLNWEIVLKKRAGYKEAFHDFDLHKVIVMSDAELETLRENIGIIRNRLKIYSVRKNALVIAQIQKEYGSFASYLWSFVDGKQIKNSFASLDDVPASTPVSDAISKDLKKRGMSFVGSTIIYAFIQGVGLVDDHISSCWRYHALR